MKALINATLISAALLAGGAANAAEFNVRIVNLTNGIWYTPFLVAAHPEGSSLFTTGQPASANLQAMAEGGDISGLAADLMGIGATIAENPAGGLLPPAMSTDVYLNTDGTDCSSRNQYYSNRHHGFCHGSRLLCNPVWRYFAVVRLDCLYSVWLVFM